MEQRRAQRARALILKVKTHAEKRAREPQIGILAPCCFRLEQIPSPRWIKGGSRGQSRNKNGSGTGRRGAEGRGTTSPATNAATKNDGKQLVESKLKSRQARGNKVGDNAVRRRPIASELALPDGESSGASESLSFSARA